MATPGAMPSQLATLQCTEFPYVLLMMTFGEPGLCR